MAQGVKSSKQRDALVALLQSTRSHPSADWLYQQLRKQFPKISLGTVYRNLALLTQSGKILRLDVGSGTEHFDGFTHEHYHFVCTDCNCILDVDLPDVSALDMAAENALDAKVQTHSFIFYGLCKNCQQGETPENKRKVI